MGQRTMRVRPVNVILGAFPNYLYQNQFHVTGQGTGAGVIYKFLSSLQISSFCRSMFLSVIVYLQFVVNFNIKYKQQQGRNQLNQILYTLYKSMKLTTVKSKPNQQVRKISNVFKLKQLIQHAANTNSLSNKQNIQLNAQPYTYQEIITTCKFPKSLKNAPFISLKTERSDRSISETSENKQNRSVNLKKQKPQLTNLKLEKLKIHPISSSHKSTNKNYAQPTNMISKSQSGKIISNKRIQCLNKSVRCKTSPREQLSIQSFSLGKKLGKGRFGNVYIAQQKSTKFLLALKIINKKQLKQAQMQQQLISEIKLQSYMRHPNILQMYGFFHDQNNIYLMLELADECLFKQLRRKNSFSEKQVAYYTKQILEGLKYLHSESIIHRDLKPQNIMIVNNVIKLADFGWSVYSPLYKRQTFCGTLDYVPPEIVKGDYYDERVDIWSLGILIFQLTFGYAPFQGSNSEQQTFQRIMSGIFEIPSNASDQLKKIIKYILIKDPRHRLNLKDIEQSNWLRAYEKQGRSISSDIWDFWEQQRVI